MSMVSKTKVNHAMILAAGRGQRMGALTSEIPKPLIKVHGKPLIEYQIERLKAVGIEHIVVNTAYKGEQIEAHCGNGDKWNLAIEYSHEEKALETAGGIKKALNRLGDDYFLVLSSDVFCDINLADIIQSELESDKATLILVNNPSHNLAGDFCFVNNTTRLIEFGHQFTFSGFGIYHRQLFECLDHGFQTLRNLFIRLAKQGRLEGLVHHGYWFDIGTPERLSWINAQDIEQLRRSSESESRSESGSES
jgi:N-acetyl-alpha-D-muramate 1-phosphate uridylyltransferase